MEGLDHKQKEQCFRSEMIFLGKAFFRASRINQRQKEKEDGSDVNELFISIIKPLHLKRQMGFNSIQNVCEAKTYGYFPATQISTIASSILKEHLENQSYDDSICMTLSKDLCSIIKEEIKKVLMPRFKVVCYVHIGQITGQDMIVASRCLWDTNADNSAHAQYANDSLFATFSAFGIPCE